MIQRYEMRGMACSSCAGTIHRTLIDIDGVRAATVDLDDGTVDVDVDGALDHALIERALDEVGYDAIAVH